MHHRLLQNPYLMLAARLVLGAVFVIAGIEKIAAPEAFAKAINNYQLVPTAALNVMALVLPWLEVIVGVFLLFGVRVQASAVLTGIMLLVFLVAILSAMARGLSIECGCFSQAQSGGGEQVGWKKVAEDVGLLLAAVYIFFAAMHPQARRFALEPHTPEQQMPNS